MSAVGQDMIIDHGVVATASSGMARYLPAVAAAVAAAAVATAALAAAAVAAAAAAAAAVAAAAVAAAAVAAATASSRSIQGSGGFQDMARRLVTGSG